MATNEQAAAYAERIAELEAELASTYGIRDNIYRREAMEHLERAVAAEAKVARLREYARRLERRIMKGER